MVLSMHFSDCCRHGKRNLMSEVILGQYLFIDSLRLPTHDLIIAKFETYGFDNISLKLFHSYFSNRKQRVKIGSAISEWIDILTGIPQGSILGHLIFNIFINDLTMFIEKTNICNFTDDNTL